MAVEPLPVDSGRRQGDDAANGNGLEEECSEGNRGVSSFRVSASAVERVAGDPGNQPEVSTSGSAFYLSDVHRANVMF